MKKKSNSMFIQYYTFKWYSLIERGKFITENNCVHVRVWN